MSCVSEMRHVDELQKPSASICQSIPKILICNLLSCLTFTRLFTPSNQKTALLVSTLVASGRVRAWVFEDKLFVSYLFQSLPEPI